MYSRLLISLTSLRDANVINCGIVRNVNLKIKNYVIKRILLWMLDYNVLILIYRFFTNAIKSHNSRFKINDVKTFSITFLSTKTLNTCLFILRILNKIVIIITFVIM